MENINYIRQEILRENFRLSKNVDRGYKTLSRLIEKNDQRLDYLLRNHRDTPIKTDREVVFRDDIDFLLAYYSILTIGIISGYLPTKLDSETVDEAYLILSNPFVEKYYKDHYKLILPQLLLKHLKTEIDLYNNESGSDKTFEHFIILINSRMNDEDIDLFLWLLDDGYTYNATTKNFLTLKELIWSIKNKENFKEIYDTPLESNYLLKSAIRGFAKFISYLDEYSNLLKENENNPTLQSAFWHMESYWFNHLDTYLKNNLEQCIENLYEIITAGYYKKFESTEVNNDILEQWKEESKIEVNKALNNINYLFNNKLSEKISKLI
ncbi:hypothetical protein ACX0HA_09165 [Flavobacterium hauense]